MLFNSYSFILLFLPLTVLAFYWISARSHRVAATWLYAMSLLFYGWWNPAYVGLLVGSICFNYSVGILLHRNRGTARMAALGCGISANLLLLAYYKYCNFFIVSVNALAGTEWAMGEIVLPLGISFFTFTQIAFLVDSYRGIVREFNFIHYGLFVTYFPHLIAGPVLHHKEMMPQFAQRSTYILNWENIGVGLTIFMIGLFKKVVIADEVARYASPTFDDYGQGLSASFNTTWKAALAYALQIYFDFSGYSDMAIGLSRLFGIILPLNFNSPYQAASIIDFWRRWHMTLSRFLRDYLYIPLGGNRKGPARRYANLLATMLLGGLWHGAGWNYLVWGGLHGLYLTVNHAWLGLVARTSGGRVALESRVGRLSSVLFTFLCVVVAWIFFRAADIGTALAMLRKMTGIDGMGIHSGLYDLLHPQLKAWVEAVGVHEVELSDHDLAEEVASWAWIGVCYGVAFFCPNTQTILGRFRPALDYNPETDIRRRWQWQATPVFLVFISICGILAWPDTKQISEFLYFQF